MQVLQHRARFEAVGATAIAVGFSPAAALAALADHLAWPFPFLSDPDRILYRRLGFPVAARRDVWTPATKDIYRQAAERGVEAHRPVEDPNQLGGDAVIGGGRVLALFPAPSPDARVPVDDLLAAVEDAARTSGIT